MHLPSLKPLLLQVLLFVLVLGAAAWIWTLPYETKPHFAKLVLCLGGALLVGRGALGAESITRQLLAMYKESPFDISQAGEREASLLIVQLYRAFLIVGVGTILLHVALSGRGV